MKWSFKWRKELLSGQYHQQLLPRGFVKPEDQEPIVEGFDFYLDAFRELSTSRPVGMDVQSIPFTAIAEYFRIWELRDFEEFAYIIRAMDNAFLDWHHSSNKGERKNGGGTNTANSNPGGHKGRAAVGGHIKKSGQGN